MKESSEVQNQSLSSLQIVVCTRPEDTDKQTREQNNLSEDQTDRPSKLQTE